MKPTPAIILVILAVAVVIGAQSYQLKRLESRLTDYDTRLQEMSKRVGDSAKPKQYEYMVSWLHFGLTLNDGGDVRTYDVSTMVKGLAGSSKQGWELVATFAYVNPQRGSDFSVFGVLRRPVALDEGTR